MTGIACLAATVAVVLWFHARCVPRSQNDVPFAKAFDEAQEYFQERFLNPVWRCVPSLMRRVRAIVCACLPLSVRHLCRLQWLFSYIPVVGGLFPFSARLRHIRSAVALLDGFAAVRTVAPQGVGSCPVFTYACVVAAAAAALVQDIISKRAVDPECKNKADLLSQFIAYSRSNLCVAVARLCSSLSPLASRFAPLLCGLRSVRWLWTWFRQRARL